MVVAIDGPAGVGKSTIARAVAETAGFLYLNSGSFYRAITWSVLQGGFDPEKEVDVLRAARSARLDMKDAAVLLDDRDVEADIHSDLVDRWVAPHSAIPEVRDIVNRQLRRIAEGKDVIMDGRDIGTVVFPDAEVKIFLDADARTRAERRFRQGTSTMGIEEIEKAIRERDGVDRGKKVGRLAQAPDALYIDTSHLTIQQVCERVTRATLLRKNNLGDIRRV
jgi:cytidylate kinase